MKSEAEEEDENEKDEEEEEGQVSSRDPSAVSIVELDGQYDWLVDRHREGANS